MAGAATVLRHRPGQYPVGDERNGGHHLLRNLAVGAAIVGTLGVGGYEADKRTDWFDRLFHPEARAAAENGVSIPTLGLSPEECANFINRYVAGSDVQPITDFSQIRIRKISQKEMKMVLEEGRTNLEEGRTYSTRDFVKKWGYKGSGYAVQTPGWTFYVFQRIDGRPTVHTSESNDYLAGHGIK